MAFDFDMIKKIYSDIVNNVDEDILPPVWNYDLKLEEVEGKFTNSLNETKVDENGVDMKAIKISSSIYDNRKMQRILTRIINPTIDSATGEKLESGDFIFERQNAFLLCIHHSKPSKLDFGTTRFTMFLSYYFKREVFQKSSIWYLCLIKVSLIIRSNEELVPKTHLFRDITFH